MLYHDLRPWDPFWLMVHRDLVRRPLGPARLRGCILLALRRMRNG